MAALRIYAGPCLCFDNQSRCVCSHTERTVRLHIAGQAPAPLTADCRAWCLHEIALNTAGSRTQAPVTLSDPDLCRAVLYAWAESCQEKEIR